MDRKENLARLKNEAFDLVIIGGGATGAGAALDGASRGLKVALIEKNDFASETSSRSTKLLHGGVRYLEQAVKSADVGQLDLVRDALRERSTLLRLAPHLCRVLPILTPIYRWIGVPYYTSGLKMYDWFSGGHSLGKSQYISKEETLRRAPMIRSEHLKGAVVYYDGQFDDARMNVSLALTAQSLGAVVVNHVEVQAFKKTQGKIRSVTAEDTLSGNRFSIATKLVINATGPYADRIRILDDPQVKPIVQTSSGAHLVLPKAYSSSDCGVLIPKTDDGRVIFLLPWMGNTLVGTTDNKASLTENPKPSAEDVSYLCREAEKYLSRSIDKKDILACWSGLRPLISDPDVESTAKLSRDHVILVSPSNLITIAGGKWTTYRLMAQDVVDKALQLDSRLPRTRSQTDRIGLVGSEDYDPKRWASLKVRFGLSDEVSQHLWKTYGALASRVVAYRKEFSERLLLAGYPFTEMEVAYACHREGAQTPTDVLARRLRLGFLNYRQMESCLEKTTQVMQTILGWDSEQSQKQFERSRAYFADPQRL